MHATAQPHDRDVFTAREIALAASVMEADVQALIDRGAVRTVAARGRGVFIAHDEAVRAGRALLDRRPSPAPAPTPATMFSFGPGRTHIARAPFAMSSAAHAGAIAALVLATTLGLGRSTTAASDAEKPEPLRMVYLALPGPGGGGGGGGLRQKIAPPKAERKGTHSIDSPLPVRRPPDEPTPVERPKDPEPPKVAPEPLPPVEAPVVAAPSDERDRAGVLETSPTTVDSRGPGQGGGAGTGTGTGIGQGDGSGLGEGSGGGTGGGPFRPGSGIEPPSVLREVKPDYTEEARQRGIEGAVVMEIVVRRDGSVGDVRVLEGLGHGLDQRAIQAVRQWRFSPATRRGAPVDVMVEVAMEFKIR